LKSEFDERVMRRMVALVHAALEEQIERERATVVDGLRSAQAALKPIFPRLRQHARECTFRASYRLYL